MRDKITAWNFTKFLLTLACQSAAF